MNVDFFKATCQASTTAKKFGLFDAENNTPTTIKFDEEDTWNATVLNHSAKKVLFTAIDHCINIFKENGDMDKCCDCMMVHDRSLILVELKTGREAWQSDGLAQIEATIKRMIAANKDYYFGFSKRKAVVANSKNQFPCFQSNNIEQREYFMRNYGVRIQFSAKIEL